MEHFPNRPDGFPPGPRSEPGYWHDGPTDYPTYPGYPSPDAYPQAPGAASASAGIPDLLELVKIFKRHALLIVICTFAGLAASGILVFLEEPEYEATAVVRVGEAREAMTQGIEAPSGEDDRFVNPFLSAIQLLTSRTVVGEVVDSAGLRLRVGEGVRPGELLQSVRVASDAEADSLWLEFGPDEFAVRDGNGMGWVGYGTPVTVGGVSFVMADRPPVDEAVWAVQPREQAIDRLLRGLRVSPRDETNVVDISFLDASPQVAQTVVNTLALVYQRFEGQFAQEQATRRREFLEEQLAETEGRLALAQGNLSSFQRSSQSYDAAGEIAAEQQNRMLLRVQIAELESERRIAIMMLDSLDAASGADERWTILRTLVASPGIAENRVVTQMHERMLQQRSVLDSLTAGAFGAAGTSPEVQRQQELVAAAEQDLANSIRSHVRSLDARAVALQELAARTDSALSNLPAQRARGERLAQVVSTYQTLSDQLREEYQRARMAEEVSVGQADIIDLARLPYEPAPNLAVIKLGLGLILGLTFGGSGALVLEYRRRSLSSKEEVEALFRVPVLGVIPRASDPFEAVPAVAFPNGNGDGPAHGPPERSRLGAGEVGTALAHPRQPSQEDIFSREAFRMLCTNLLFAGWTKDAKTLSITSTLPQEGKTLVTTNLAVAMANEGLRVLLVDADIWRGRVHKVFGVPVSPGLSEILRGESHVPRNGSANGSGIVRTTPVPGLSLLPRGESGASPSLLSRGTPLRGILSELSEDYDFVLVDGPPVLAAGTAPVLCAATDGVVMLVQAGRTERESIEEALKSLRTVGGNLRGAILNDPKGLTSAELRRYHYYEYART